MGAISNLLSDIRINSPEGSLFDYSSLILVFIFSVLIVIYSIFTWKFYRYLSKKDLISLNLQQYNRTEHPGLNKFFAGVLYLLEYIIILPIIVFFWFAVLGIMVLALSEELAASQIIIVAASLVIAIRILSYYEENLAQELAKIFPFTLLAIFIINPSFFSLQRIITNLKTVPEFAGELITFLVLMAGVEFLFRIIDLIVKFFSSNDEEN